MALHRDAYRALEGVVGAKYISEDPAVLVGYSFASFGFYVDVPAKWNPMSPACVVLPENTEQVQSIVKLCNRYDLKFKAHATGFGPWGLDGIGGGVCLDLRRMNRIEIDEKNMFAIIEPYVLAGEVQAEAAKFGLDCQIVLAGPSHSPLASTTSVWGMGSKGLTASYNERNCFGVEWVLPSGELVRLGSPAIDAGWYSADGPGPGLRGIMRGFNGAFGGAGVFTKIGFKLHPYQGDVKIECTGQHPNIGMKTPENMKFYFGYWSCVEDQTEALYKIIENNVAVSIVRRPVEALGWYLTKTNDEFLQKFKEGSLLLNGDHRWNWSVIIGGQSKREFEFRDKIFKQIVKDTKGRIMDLPQDVEEFMLYALHRAVYVPRHFRPTGDFLSSFGYDESASQIPRITKIGEKIYGEFVKKGILPDIGPEGFWTWSHEGRRVHHECAFNFNPHNVESKRGSLGYVLATLDPAMMEQGIGEPMISVGPLADVCGPSMCDAHKLMRKIKYEVLDEKNTCDHSFYIYPKPVEM